MRRECSILMIGGVAFVKSCLSLQLSKSKSSKVASVIQPILDKVS